MSELAPMREQVYTDPRPKEYFDRFHERARTREPDWVYEIVRVITSLYAYTFLRARAISVGERARQRRGDPRAQPLLVHGPLPDGLLHPPQGPLHGQVAAVQAADAGDLHPRRRLPRAPRRARRGDVHHRRGDPRARRCDHDVLRGRPLAHRASSPSRPSAGIGRLALETGAPVVPIAIHGSSHVRNWKRLQFPKVTVQYGEPMRWEPSRTRRASSSRRSPTRSSPRSAACTRASSSTGARASCGACASSAGRARPRAPRSPERRRAVGSRRVGPVSAPARWARGRRTLAGRRGA